MDPQRWGTQFWQTLFAIAYVYPEKPTFNEQQRYREFFHLVSDVLPCYKCRVDFGIFLKTNPVQLHSKDDLLSWLLYAYNSINYRVSKKKSMT
jgi:mitochondrial FAD-linked sulfhydryl oxidase